jgi:ABC-type glycerol-3-phosphate transport system substrate-binding protein
MARRSMPALVFALFLAACGGSSTSPAVDSKLLQQRLDQFVTAVRATAP